MTSLGVWLSARTLAPLLIPPVYIAIVSTVERRWGQTWSGRLTAIPTQTTAVILLVALTQGTTTAGAVAAGALLGVISLSAFSVAYGFAAQHASWRVSVTVALAAFFGAGLILAFGHGTPPVDAAAAIGAVAVTLAVLHRLERPAREGKARPIGLPARMAVSAALVLGVSLSVPYLGPIGAGTLGVFPIITAPMTVLNHQESGPGAAVRYLTGLEWGLVGGVVFFLTLSTLLAPSGLAVAFSVGIPLLVVTLLGVFLLLDRGPRAIQGR